MTQRAPSPPAVKGAADMLTQNENKIEFQIFMMRKNTNTKCKIYMQLKINSCESPLKMYDKYRKPVGPLPAEGSPHVEKDTCRVQ